ncbi:MAG: VOC family protein [Phycisphaerae bacterium]|jgi:catechol 2,3-dioxygenase-like lactoylglutathione lyase family enzyme|nr:MAG: VOC family protein [Phycisphaerae bacterium]
MIITHTHHVALCTPQFPRIVDFYTVVLGLKPVGRFDGRNIVFLQAGSTTIEIIERNEPVHPSRTGWVHFAFEVPDVDAAYQELLGKGIVFHIPPKLFPENDPEVKIAFFKDPDGNELELVQPIKTRYPNQSVPT